MKYSGEVPMITATGPVNPSPNMYILHNYTTILKSEN